MLISLELQHAHLSRAFGAVRIALERAKVWRLIPWAAIQHVKEGCVNSKHAKDWSQHLECTCHMLMAPCTEIPMLSKKKSASAKSHKKMPVPCTCEFAVYIVPYALHI